jgi:hypothetical protein
MGIQLANIKVGSNGSKKIGTMFFMMWPIALPTFVFSPLVKYDVEPHILVWSPFPFETWLYWVGPLVVE